MDLFSKSLDKTITLIVILLEI